MNCRVKLFPNLDFNLSSYEDEIGDRDYYVFHRANGWMHRSQLANPTALSRDVKVVMPDENYGRHTTPEKVASLTR